MSGTQASIEQFIFQISVLSNKIKTLNYLPPVLAVFPPSPLYQDLEVPQNVPRTIDMRQASISIAALEFWMTEGLDGVNAKT